MGKKPLHIRLDKIDGFIEIYGVIRYLVLLGFKEVYDKIKCLISEKSGITDNTDRNFARIRIDSYNSLPIGKILTFHFVIKHIKLVFIEEKLNYHKINYYYNIFLGKGS